MECYCCGEDRDPATVAALKCHQEIGICRVCAGWLSAQTGAVDVTPTLPVADMTMATSFYETAGFRVHRYDAGFAFVHLEDSSVFDLDLIDGLDPATNAAGCYLITEEVDRWHRRFLDAGLAVTHLQDEPWGMREFTLTDPSGNHLRFGRAVLPSEPARMVTVEVQYTADCPNTPAILQRIGELADSRAAITLKPTPVAAGQPTPAGFSGSPTILIDGRNPFAGEPVDDMACALRPPTVDQVEAALDGVRIARTVASGSPDVTRDSPTSTAS